MRAIGVADTETATLAAANEAYTSRCEHELRDATIAYNIVRAAKLAQLVAAWSVAGMRQRAFVSVGR